jgi:glycosyltransferase involved in cell wall biosynthesis
VPLLFADIGARYRCVYREDGTLQTALERHEAGHNVIVHVQWEEFVLRDCVSQAEADAETAKFLHEIAALGKRGVPIVWTVHNEVPHVIAYDRQFLSMRAWLAGNADAILFHDRTSMHVISEQVAFDGARAYVLPHPSYIDRYESQAELSAGLAHSHDAVIAGFGWIRLQKGFSEMIEMLPLDFLDSLGARIRISGEDAQAGAVRAQTAARSDVIWDVRHVPSVEVPRLLRSAACVVLPYERVLTSGVALLAMSVGAMIVAVDIPQLRELLPAQSSSYLYPRGDGAALRAVIRDVFALSREHRARIVAENLEVARARRPTVVARRLAEIYDHVRTHAMPYPTAPAIETLPKKNTPRAASARAATGAVACAAKSMRRSP